MSASAVPAAYCELACTESCERVSSLTPVGEDILLVLVYSTEKFPAKLIQNCKLRRWIFSLFNLGQFPASLANQSPIPQFQAWSSSICLPPANAWFQLIVLYSQLNPSRQPPLGSSYHSSSFVFFETLATPLRPLLPRHSLSFRLGKPLVWLRNHFVRLSRYKSAASCCSRHV